MRVIVVGVCAAGKTVLVQKLQQLGYDADTVAQEHSYVASLWKHSSPDVVIYLDAALATIRKRRDPDFDEQLLADEHERLAQAREACDLYVKTDELNEDQVFRRVRRFLEKWERGEISRRAAKSERQEERQRTEPGASGRLY
jgi:RNase adaptor protein for sRNA GlmZ degradation